MRRGGLPSSFASRQSFRTHSAATQAAGHTPSTPNESCNWEIACCAAVPGGGNQSTRHSSRSSSSSSETTSAHSPRRPSGSAGVGRTTTDLTRKLPTWHGICSASTFKSSRSSSTATATPAAAAAALCGSLLRRSPLPARFRRDATNRTAELAAAADDSQGCAPPVHLSSPVKTGARGSPVEAWVAKRRGAGKMAAGAEKAASDAMWSRCRDDGRWAPE
mmetsp:Transcript_67021/g.218191  ORF Transcript_67021/g.218191 Transcript_67021/m.218191 type:complete len:219 (-) Transcript_67021:8-664(-)